MADAPCWYDLGRHLDRQVVQHNRREKYFLTNEDSRTTDPNRTYRVDRVRPHRTGPVGSLIYDPIFPSHTR